MTPTRPSDPITTRAELNALPVGAIVETGSGLRYRKRENGRWWMRYAQNTPPGWLLDPEHSKQPIRLIETRQIPIVHARPGMTVVNAETGEEYELVQNAKVNQVLVLRTGTGETVNARYGDYQAPVLIREAADE